MEIGRKCGLLNQFELRWFSLTGYCFSTNLHDLGNRFLFMLLHCGSYFLYRFFGFVYFLKVFYKPRIRNIESFTSKWIFGYRNGFYLDEHRLFILLGELPSSSTDSF